MYNKGSQHRFNTYHISLISYFMIVMYKRVLVEDKKAICKYCFIIKLSTALIWPTRSLDTGRLKVSFGIFLVKLRIWIRTFKTIKSKICLNGRLGIPPKATQFTKFSVHPLLDGLPKPTFNIASLASLVKKFTLLIFILKNKTNLVVTEGKTHKTNWRSNVK
jgi:hypothetical protein